MKISELLKLLEKDVSVKDLHRLADKKGILWDNDKAFMRLTKQVTGKEHLDDLNAAERRAMAAKLSKCSCTLKEETLQQAVKRLLRPAGAFSALLSKTDAAQAADLLLGAVTDPVFVLRAETPQAEKILKSVVMSRPYDTTTSEEHGVLRVVRMPGGARLLVVGEGPTAFVVTTAFQLGRLVEDVNG